MKHNRPWLRRALGLAAVSALLCTGLALTPPAARAWNSTGHMTVADIAYDNLTPATKTRVDALLQRHRDYALWMSEMPAGYTDKARFAFMKASTWPDDIRKTPDDRPIWHYEDIPIVAPGYTADPIALLPIKPNAGTQIVAESAALVSPAGTDAERAVDLCWVEHLIGDVHQPLHATSYYSALFPKGDKGGNAETLARGSVTGDPLLSAARPRKLHSLWDDLLGKSQDPVDIQKYAAVLETPAYARKTYPQLATGKTVHDWLLESNALAQSTVYLNSTLPMTPGEGTLVTVTLPPGYLAAAHTVASRQIALAGYRLADTLNAMTIPTATAPVTTTIPAPAAPADAPETPAAPADAPAAPLTAPSDATLETPKPPAPK